MFSVLADWIFGDSSSSDSLDSSSSSSSDDFFSGSISSTSTVSMTSAGQNGVVWVPPGENLEGPVRRHARKGQGLRGTNIIDINNNNAFHPPFPEFEAITAFLFEEDPLFAAAADAAETSSEEFDRYYAEYGGEMGYPSVAEGEATAALEAMERKWPVFSGEEEEVEFWKSGGVLRQEGARANDFPPPRFEPGWETPPEEDFPMFAGEPRVHPKRHHRGDHIRFRNPLPEDFENQRAWLSDSFDADGDGPDLIEAVLAFFFFIGAVTLMLLPFFLLGRALKRMVRNGGGGDAEAPDGYYALPEDAAAAGMVSADDDGDDSIVVTGTPVNPPPSVHL